MNTNKSKEAEYLNQAFGCWMISLFGWFPDQTFDEQKAYFLDLLERLLNEGRIVLFPPYRYKREDGGFNATCKSLYGRDDIWDVSSEEVIDYFKEVWPKEARHMHDSSLNLFWYLSDCPGLGWVDEENKAIVAS